MEHDTTYRTKFAMLKKWLPAIIDTVRKDLKKDHLKKDPIFQKQYLGGKPVNKLTNEELAHGYAEALESDEYSEVVGEFIANRWLLKHSDVYYHFEKKLSSLERKYVQDTDALRKQIGNLQRKLSA